MTKKIAIGKVTCNMCGDIYYYKGEFNEHVSKDKDNLKFNQYWVHEFNLNSIGYGSFLDSFNCTIHICDSCLENIFKDMKIKPFFGGDVMHTYSRVVQLIEMVTDVPITDMPMDEVYEIANIILEMGDPIVDELRAKLEDIDFNN